MTPDLVVVGNLAVDDIVYNDGTTRMGQPGGAVLYAALAARLWGVEVGIVSLAGDDYPAPMLEAMTERGIDLGGVRSIDGPGLRTWLLYEGSVRRVVHRLDAPSHEAASPGVGEFPDGWRPRHLHLAPMPMATQSRLVEELAPAGGASLSLDPFELLRTEELDSWRPLLAAIDLFLFSEDEWVGGGVDWAPQTLLEQLAGGRLQTIVFKRGADGGLAYDARVQRFLEWPARSQRVEDPTGAGDAFAGGLVAGLLLGDELPQALERGVVAASFALEGLGAEGLCAATRERAESRFAEWFGT